MVLRRVMRLLQRLYEPASRNRHTQLSKPGLAHMLGNRACASEHRHFAHRAAAIRGSIAGNGMSMQRRHGAERPLG